MLLLCGVSGSSSSSGSRSPRSSPPLARRSLQGPPLLRAEAQQPMRLRLCLGRRDHWPQDHRRSSLQVVVPVFRRGERKGQCPTFPLSHRPCTLRASCLPQAHSPSQGPRLGAEIKTQKGAGLLQATQQWETGSELDFAFLPPASCTLLGCHPRTAPYPLLGVPSVFPWFSNFCLSSTFAALFQFH